jgi:hypothetical protein
MMIPAPTLRSTSWWAAPALTLLLLAAPAARSDDKPAAPPAAPAKAPGPTVKLLEAGAEPRAPLRLRIPKGQKEKGSMSLSMKGSAHPQTIAMEFTTETKEPTPEREIPYDLVLGRLGMDTGQAAGSSVQKAMDAALGTLKGAVASGTVTERGQSKGLTFRLPDGVSPLVKDSFEQALDQMKDYGPPFLPEEPVGLGGRWEVAAMLTVNGMTLDNVAVYTLKARAGDRLDLAVVVTQTGRLGPVQLPGAPPEPKVELVSQSATGSGTLQCDLARFTPIKYEMKTSATSQLKISTGGKTVDRSLDTQADMAMSGELLPATTSAGSGSGGK